MSEPIRSPKLLCLILLLAGTTLSWAGTIDGEVHFQGHAADRKAAVVYVADIQDPPIEATAVMDQKNLEFMPHLLVIQRGTTVQFPNDDPLKHNVYSISAAERFNLGMYAQGESRSLVFDRVGVVKISCAVHLQMSAYIVVVPNKYFAVVGADGRFRIPNVPAGLHELHYWQESSGEQVLKAQVPDQGSVTIRVDDKQTGTRAG